MSLAPTTHLVSPWTQMSGDEDDYRSHSQHLHKTADSVFLELPHIGTSQYSHQRQSRSVGNKAQLQRYTVKGPRFAETSVTSVVLLKSAGKAASRRERKKTNRDVQSGEAPLADTHVDLPIPERKKSTSHPSPIPAIPKWTSSQFKTSSSQRRQRRCTPILIHVHSETIVRTSDPELFGLHLNRPRLGLSRGSLHPDESITPASRSHPCSNSSNSSSCVASTSSSLERDGREWNAEAADALLGNGRPRRVQGALDMREKFLTDAKEEPVEEGESLSEFYSDSEVDGYYTAWDEDENDEGTQ